MKAKKVYEAFTLKGPSEEQIEDAWDKMTPNEMLFNASAGDNIEKVKEAIKKGADIHIGNDSSLRWAILHDNLNIVKYLIEQGADIHAKKDMALSWAAEKGYLDIVKYLVEKGANIEADDGYALLIAGIRGHLDVVEYLKSKLDVKESFYPELDEAFILKGPSEEQIKSAQEFYEYKTYVFNFLLKEFNAEEAMSAFDVPGVKEVLDKSFEIQESPKETANKIINMAIKFWEEWNNKFLKYN